VGSGGEGGYKGIAGLSKVPSYLRDLLPPPEVWEALTRLERLKVLEELAREKSGVALHDILEKLREKLPYLDERVRKLEEKGLPADPLQLSLTTPAALRASILWDLIGRAGLLDFYKVDWWGKGSVELYVALKGDRVLFELDPLHSLARALAGDLYTAGVERELERCFRDKATYLTRKQVNPWEYVAVENGILSLKTFELLGDGPALPNCYFTAYAPVAVRESFLRDLREGRISEEYFAGRAFYRLFRPRYDDYNWDLLKRALGSALLPWPEGALVFVQGETMARKTVLAKLLPKTLGNLCVAVSLGKLVPENRFATYRLAGARLAVASEEEDVVVRKLGTLKAITGGDTLPVEDKFVREREAEICVTLLVFVNKIPRFRKVDSAVKKRVLIIRTRETEPHSVEEKALIEETLRRPEEFFEYLLYCAWELRQRYDELKWGLKTEEEFDRVGEELLLAADNVRKFFEDALRDRSAVWHIRYVSGAETSPEALYGAYTEWCQLYGEEPVSERDFKDRIEYLLQRVGVTYGRERRGTKKVWRNLMLGPEPTKEEALPPEEAMRWEEGG
jgi:phage/plasmid-associated DNA primase